ncbi:hypothetical protein GCM10011390_09230 [Aureimonas endophytica]|uniref:Nudix hydrolase domain-containing protein n=1 Tax=Aureimonas endophytica TaxID=2027858 RepID=A0A916ZFS9_9HYPH|nr:NUDIX hydrolase [Aureimonas endophytica]GGD92647.1 hypothetical protein GCM10011390_09230 [Aureimonas endophytica]
MASSKRNKQYGALPYRIGQDGEIEVLLVTTRGTGRWIVPKGWPMRLLPPHKAAAREAFEEAGVIGKPRRKAVGSFDYDKLTDDGSMIRCTVRVFPLKVERLEENWREALQRRRQWFGRSEAADLVEEPELKDILRSYSPPSGNG